MSAETPQPELIACPFCGEAELLCIDCRHYSSPDEAPVQKHVAACLECGAEVAGTHWADEGLGAPGFDTAAEAAAAWNMRKTARVN